MLLDPGTRLGPYEVVAPLGTGGMGEVYRAKDTRLGREVAIKVLPQHLSQNPEIRARFEREAKTVSGLNHPHICVLYDVGREGDTDYLVMELIEGDTLAARLRRGPLPGNELLRFGAQIADALDRAHRAGVIHRDLKPANVMLTRGGAKLMDFGLSRVTGMAGGGSGSGSTPSALTQSPTIAQALTSEGTLLGTFQYMSPEQLEGREADARSDIWALGCVLYEMATGRRAFEGRSQASLIAAILEREPAAVGEVPSGSVSQAAGAPPHGIDRLIRNCLAKDPDDRIQTAHDVKLQLQGIAEVAGMPAVSTASAVGAPLPARRAAGSRLPWLAAATIAIVAAGGLAWVWPRLHATAPAMRFRVGNWPGVTDVYWPRVSPDSRNLLLVALDSTGIGSAYVRRMDQIETQPVPGTRGIARAYWSADGREIAFVAEDKIQRVPIAGGSPTVVCASPGGADLSWGSRGLILMDGQNNDSLRVVPASGGELRPATRIDRAGGEIGSGWPCFLPDGRHFLFIGTLASSNTTGNIRLGAIGSLDSKLLGQSDGRVEYAPGGWVLYLKGTTLMAQKLDVAAGKLTGQPLTIAEHLRLGSSQGHFSISNDGVLAFGREVGGGRTMLHATDREGSMRGMHLASGVIAFPTISPDGRSLAYVADIGTQGTGEVHVIDLARGSDRRLTFTDGSALFPCWSPDGRRIAFVTAGAAGGPRIRIASADGMGGVDSLALPVPITPNLRQWTDDGRLVFNFSRRAWAVPVAGGAVTGLADTTGPHTQCAVSPDGRWLASVAQVGVQAQIFVDDLSGSHGRWQVTTQGGLFPHWTRQGREIVYETVDGRLMAVALDTRAGFQSGAPQQLFALPMRSPLGAAVSNWACDATGTQFFVMQPAAATNDDPIEVVSGFEALVHRK